MKIIMMVAADYAAVEPQTGKINILGLFRQIGARVFPVSLPRMCFVVKVEGEISDSPNPHLFKLKLVDEDGEEILNLEGSFDMPSSTIGMPLECNVVMEINHLNFQKPGQYRLFVSLDDGVAEESTVIQVIQQEV